MKSLDYYLSAVISPYDDLNYSQDELLLSQNLQFEKQSVLTSIGTKMAKIQFDLNFEDIRNQLNTEDFQLFLNDCLKRMNSVYSLETLMDYIFRRGMLENNTDEIVQFIKYVIREEWVQSISFSLPILKLNEITDKSIIRDLLTAHYFEIQNKIINRDDVNLLLHFHFENCSVKSGVNTLETLVLSDLPGVLSAQLLKL